LRDEREKRKVRPDYCARVTASRGHWIMFNITVHIMHNRSESTFGYMWSGVTVVEKMVML